MATYKQVRDLFGAVSTTMIQRIEDGAFIPNDAQNKDWSAYLVWAQTNTIAPADPAPDPALNLAAERLGAFANLVNGTDPNNKLMRAILLVILDEINVIRGLLAPSQSARTVVQMKNAIQNKLTSGTAD